MSSAALERRDDPVIAALERHLAVLDATRADLHEVGKVHGALLRVYGADPAETPNRLDRMNLASAAALMCLSAVSTSALLILAVVGGFGLGFVASLVLILVGLSGVVLMVLVDRVAAGAVDDGGDADDRTLIAWQPAQEQNGLGTDDRELRMRLQRALYPERPRRRRRIGVIRAIVTILAGAALAFGVDLALFKTDVNVAAKTASVARARAEAEVADQAASRAMREHSFIQDNNRERFREVSAEIQELQKSVREAGFSPYTGCPNSKRSAPTACERRLDRLRTVKREREASSSLDRLSLDEHRAARRVDAATSLARRQRTQLQELQAMPAAAVEVSSATRVRKLLHLLASDVAIASLFATTTILLVGLMLAGPLLRRSTPSEYELRREQRARLRRLILARKRFIADDGISPA